MYRTLAATVALILLAGGGRAADPIDARQFERLQATIRPQPAETKWEQVRWLANLWQARKQAATQGKPILLWEMDGHPLGCV